MSAEKEFRVSVVTPFHNVDMNMFDSCRKSMVNQTIGFENIQWIIVLHNCEEHYHNEIPQMFEKDDNVLVLRLDNNTKTPSSPRNYGISYATGPYIGFLDGDDSYTPDCLRKATEEIIQTKSQVVCFRRGYEKQRSDLTTLTETILWDQLNERIVVDRDNWDSDKMFNGVFGMVTSKLFDRKFLSDKGLTFDETIPYAEDMQFVANAFAAAEKICYLPQFIGYHYYINESSLVQSNGKSGETLVDYARGLVKIFETYRSYGINSDSVNGLCMQLSFFILGSSDITSNQRNQIKKLLEPYVIELDYPPQSKLNDEHTCELMYYIPREVILNPDNPYIGRHVTGMKDGSLALFSILKKNTECDYGKHYSFSAIKTIEAFRFRVPLSTSKTIKPLMDLCINVGEKKLLTSSYVMYYCSDQEGNLIPFTNDHIQQYSQSLAESLNEKKSLLIGRIEEKKISNDGTLILDLKSIIIKHFLHEYIEKNPKYKYELTSKRGVYFSYHGNEAYAKLIEDSLLKRDLEQIVAIDTADVLKFFEILIENAEKFIEQIRIKDGERAEELKGIIDEGVGESIAKRIWPELQRIIAFGAGELYDITSRMKKYTGNIPHNNGYYYTEEAILGEAVEDNSNEFVNVSNSTYYELLPIKGEESDTVPLSQAEVGVPYQLVITNTSGLYRYVTNHFVMIKSVEIGETHFTIY